MEFDLIILEDLEVDALKIFWHLSRCNDSGGNHPFRIPNLHGDAMAGLSLLCGNGRYNEYLHIPRG